MTERLSSIDQYVDRGGGAEKTQQYRETMERIFSRQEFENLLRLERPSTPEERHIIDLANTATDAWFKQYGGQALKLSSKHVHFLEPAQWAEYTTKFGISDMADAGYVQEGQGVVVKTVKPNTYLAKKIVHELVHFKSYNAAQISDSGAGRYRIGFETVDRKSGSRLTFLNEGLTELATMKILEQLKNDPLFADDARETASTLAWLGSFDPAIEEEKNDIVSAYVETNDQNEDQPQLLSYSYPAARHGVRLLAEKIHRATADRFATANDVIDLFFAGMSTGNMLPTGKLIDRTFGRGTFRTLGEQPDSASFKKAVEYLPETKAS